MAETKPEWAKRVHKAMDYITANLERKLSLEEIAAASALSKFHFHRIFRLVTGETVTDFSRRARLQSAARTLQHSPESVTRLAHELGFSSAQNFARAFKKQFGRTPSKFRGADLEELVIPKGGVQKHSSEKVLLNEPNLVELRETPVAYVRVLGPYVANPSTLKSCTQAYFKLLKWGKRFKVKARPVIAVGWDAPGLTPPEFCRSDFCLPLLNQPPEMGEQVAEGVLPGGTFLYGECKVIGHDFDSPYLALLDKLLIAGFTLLDRPCYEVYDTSLPRVLSGNFPLGVYLPVESSSEQSIKTYRFT